MPKLTDRYLKGLALEPGQKDRLVFDDEVRGLGVRVTAKGTKAFLVQWTDVATKRKVREPIGVWGSITVEQARAAARAKLGEVARGIDPSAERKRKKAEADAQRADRALTLDKLLSSWTDLHLGSKSANYRREAPRALRMAFANHLAGPASALTKAHVLAAFDEITAAGRAAMARQTVVYGKTLFGWARRRGQVASNPFEDLPIVAPRFERERVLSDVEVAEIWKATGLMPWPFGPFIRMALLTLQRREEVAGMRWSEMSADRATWSIAAERMKNNRSHDVQLAPEARRLIEGLPRMAGADMIFTTTGRTPISGYSGAKRQLDAIIVKLRAEKAAGAGQKPAKLVPWRLHDFRRTGVSRLAALGFDSIVADKLLAHKPAKLRGVASVYQRHDFAAERRRALEAWAEHVTGADPAGNVVPFKREGAGRAER